MKINKKAFSVCLLVLILLAFPANAFSDDFNDGDLADWTIGAGSWSASNYYAYNLASAAAGSSQTNWITHNITPDNYNYASIALYFYSTGSGGNIWREQFFFFGNSTHYLILNVEGTIGGSGSATITGTTLASGTLPFQQWYGFYITRTGSSIRMIIINSTGSSVYDQTGSITQSLPTNSNIIKIQNYVGGNFGVSFTNQLGADNIDIQQIVPVGDIHFNATSYKNYNTAQINYILNSPSFSAYDYKIETRNANTLEVKDTWSITTSNGSVTTPLANYGSANYYAVLSRKLKTETTWTDVDYDITSVTAVVYLQGKTYNVEGGTVIPTVNVNTSQLGTWKNTTSDSVGNYSIYDYSSNNVITVNASKVNFTHVNYSWTPLANILYNQNLYLFPTNITRSSGGVHGVVMDDKLYQAISGASVTISNATWNTSVTSNSLGYYNFLDLTDGIYNLTAYKTGLAEQVNYSINITSQNTWIIQNILLSLKYTLTVRAQDSVSTAYLATFTTCIEGTCTDTTNSFTTHTLYYGAYYVSVSSQGYYANGKTIILTGDATETIQLTKLPTETTSTVFKTLPHNVKFLVMDRYGNEKAGVNVSVQGYNTTATSWTWLSSLLGIDFGVTPINNATMNGYTGSDGSISFMMIENVYYNIKLLKQSEGINYSYWLYPQDYSYIIIAPTAETVWGKYTTQIKDTILVNVTKSTVNSTHAFINVTYLDKLNKTTALKIYVNQSIQGDMKNQTIISSWTGSGNLNNTQNNFSITGYSGQSYFVHVVSQHSTYGQVDITYAVNFEKSVEVPGISSKFLLWIAISIMFFLGAVFTYRTAEQGALIICILGWIFLAVGAFDSISKTQMGIGLTFATLIAIFALIKKHTREEGYS